ncbi:Hypothetical predicted protein [Pelobates cultripes]|uniref:Uncharacterized protein n=1 Tax=Pelobates cultripes TaxID=61616 RepID=A0AAD1RER5_PELCU|nr:Hypothetical predicted protein [Pelobates cultripes]
MAAAVLEQETDERHKSLEQRLDDLIQRFWRKITHKADHHKQVQRRHPPTGGSHQQGEPPGSKRKPSTKHVAGPAIATRRATPKTPRGPRRADKPGQPRRPSPPPREQTTFHSQAQHKWHIHALRKEKPRRPLGVKHQEHPRLHLTQRPNTGTATPIILTSKQSPTTASHRPQPQDAWKQPPAAPPAETLKPTSRKGIG